MINMTKIALKCSDISLISKYDYLTFPNFYWAENIGDFLENKSDIEMPWYKGFPIPIRIIPREEHCAFVMLYNINIDLVRNNPKNKRNVYRLNNGTSNMIAYLYDSNGRFPPESDFEGLNDEDYAHLLVLRYLINKDHSAIMHISRRKFSHTEKRTLIDLLTDLVPILQPVKTQ